MSVDERVISLLYIRKKGVLVFGIREEFRFRLGGREPTYQEPHGLSPTKSGPHQVLSSLQVLRHTVTFSLDLPLHTPLLGFFS